MERDAVDLPGVMSAILCVNKASYGVPGGAEARLIEVAKRWAAAGYRIYVLCAKLRPDEPMEEVLDGMTVRRVAVMPKALLARYPIPHYLPQALFYLVAWPYVLYFAKKWKITSIRDSMSPFPALGWLVPFFGHRTIVVVHVLFGGLRQWRKYYPWPFAICGWLGERLLLAGLLPYRSIITDSPWLAAHIRRHGRRGLRVRAIENGIDFASIPLRVGGRPIRKLLNAARMVEHKAQLDLVRACSELVERGTSFSLDLYGAGPLAETIRSEIERRQLQGYVRILPPLNRARFLHLLADYDLYVMTSYSEGLPVVLLEAMAAQLPIVVARREYATSLIPEDLVKYYNPEVPGDLASSIKWAIEHAAGMDQVAVRGREFIKHMTWERTAREELQELQARDFKG